MGAQELCLQKLGYKNWSRNGKVAYEKALCSCSALARNPEVMVSGGDNAQDLESHFSWA